GTYMVAAPSAAVALDKMNVFYIGVPNPISVSAGGVAPSELSVSGSGGIKLSPKGGAGKYEVTATTPGSVTISVSAKTKDGMKPQGTFKFRVKKIPDPVAKVGGKSGNVDMKKIELSSIGGVVADLPGFDFEAKFVVTSFELTAVVKGVLKSEVCSGNSLSSAARQILATAGVGSKIFIENVKAKGPDGSIRNIPGVTIKVK
ncbi:MAG: GldM family protein, partial [Bacteroidota bacterium]|nr:GldM family protein [Bacteroidota bacterium]